MTHASLRNSINTISMNSKASDAPSVVQPQSYNEASGDVILDYVQNNSGLMSCVEIACHVDTYNTHGFAVYKPFAYIRSATSCIESTCGDRRKAYASLGYGLPVCNDAHECGENKECYSANGGMSLCSELTNSNDATHVERHCNEWSIISTGSDTTYATKMNVTSHSGSRRDNRHSLRMMDHVDCSYCSRNSRQLFDWMASDTTTNRRGVTSTGKCEYYLVRICVVSSGYPFGGRSFSGNKWNLQLHELID